MTNATATDFILIPNSNVDEEWPVNTNKEILKAARALGKAGLDEAPVYRGEAPDTIKTNLVIVAR